MLKISVLVTRRSDLTLEQFEHYWNDHHTPLLMSMPEMHGLVRRYVQLHRVDVPGLPVASFDGVAEIWVDDLDAAMALLTSESYTSIVAEDEERFLDRAQTVVFFSQEKTV